MLEYLYMLIRYVPVMERMEPINVGIILQGGGLTDYRLSPAAAKRRDVDTESFRKWRQFFQEEVKGTRDALFQPDKASPEFLLHLARLCQGPIFLSQPLAASVAETSTFDEVLDRLFRKLVLSPKLESPAEISRPTGRFRKLAEERRFLQRGMKRYVPIPLPEERRWMAYRQVLNGEYIAVDKVEVAREIGRTATEIDKITLVAELLDRFMSRAIDGKNTRYVLLADALTQPFSDQSDSDFSAMRQELELAVERIGRAGGQVIRNPRDAEHFAEELDQKLPLIG